MKVIKCLASLCFSLISRFGFKQCVYMNDEVNSLLSFPPSSMLHSPVFVASIVLLARICNVYIMFWNYNRDLILITYQNRFRSPSLRLPFPLYSCDFYLVLIFLFKNFLKKDSLTPIFCVVFHIWECLPIILDLSFLRTLVLVAQSSLISLMRKISESTSIPSPPPRSCHTFSGRMPGTSFFIIKF